MEVAYLDCTGRGAETVAHLRENGRIVLMFCAFDGKPEIVRLHGRGRVLTEGAEGFRVLVSLFPPNLGTRAVVRMQVTRVSTSCGFSVPRMNFQGGRDTLDRWAAAKGPVGLNEYHALKNARSIDGLPTVVLDTKAIGE